MACECTDVHKRRRAVLTGGPGAGKTALLELIHQSFCSHVKVLPEAASVVFGGGFPTEDDPTSRRAAQRAIFRCSTRVGESAGDSHNPARPLSYELRIRSGQPQIVAGVPSRSALSRDHDFGSRIYRQPSRRVAVISRAPPSNRSWDGLWEGGPSRHHKCEQVSTLRAHVGRRYLRQFHADSPLLVLLS